MTVLNWASNCTLSTRGYCDMPNKMGHSLQVCRKEANFLSAGKKARKKRQVANQTNMSELFPCYHRCIESNYKSVASCRPNPAADVVVNSYMFLSEVFFAVCEGYPFDVSEIFWGSNPSSSPFLGPCCKSTPCSITSSGANRAQVRSRWRWPGEKNRDCCLTHCERQKDPFVWLTGPFLRAVVTALHVIQHFHTLTWFCV